MNSDLGLLNKRLFYLRFVPIVKMRQRQMIGNNRTEIYMTSSTYPIGRWERLTERESERKRQRERERETEGTSFQLPWRTFWRTFWRWVTSKSAGRLKFGLPIDYNFKDIFQKGKKDYIPVRSQERPLGFLGGHGGDGPLPSQLGCWNSAYRLIMT